MVFQVQPSNKGKKKIGRLQKQGLTFAAHRDALAAETSEGEPEDPPETANGPAGDALPPSSNKRVDSNWRSNRAFLNAKRAAAKAKAEINAVRADNSITKNKLKEANARVKQVEHKQYLDKKVNRVNVLKTEEEHKVTIERLYHQFNEELEAAEEAAGVETAKRLAEEARRINAEEKHSRVLRGEIQHYADKVKREQTKLEKERHGQQLQIDHLHNQWKEKKKQLLDSVKDGNKKR